MLSSVLASLAQSWHKLKAVPRTERQTAQPDSSNGLLAIFRKELSDQIHSWRMIILGLVMAVTTVASLYVASIAIREAVDTAGIPFVFLQLFTASDRGLPSFASFVGFLAPLLGLALGFDAIGGEQSRRTLSRLLAQPIHRDAVINGKFLAGIAAIALLFLALMLVTGAEGLLMIGIPPTGDELLRLLAFAGVTVIYMAFWLALSILLSVIFRQAATSALAGIAIWLFFTIFFDLLVSVAVGGISDPMTQAQWQLALGRLSPGVLYSEAVTTLLTPTVRTLGLVTVEQVIGALESVLPFGQSLLLVWPQIVGLIAATSVCFGLSYVLFMRREVRA